MANIAFDFSTESFLFCDSYIDENFRTVPEELIAELQKYREYIQKSFADIVQEVQNNNELNVSIESAGELPNEQLLKQLALYLDKVVIATIDRLKKEIKHRTRAIGAFSDGKSALMLVCARYDT